MSCFINYFLNELQIIIRELKYRKLLIKIAINISYLNLNKFHN